ncbi:MAG: WG repeat-containing protein [Bacteroidia bacterium]
MKRSAYLLICLFSILGTQAQSPVQMGEKIAYIDSNGTLINQGMFKRGTAFSDGMAAVDVSAAGNKPKWFFIHTDFTIAIPYGYDSVGQFVGERCPVKKNGSWFYIGLDGLIRIDAQFTEAGNFIQGRARVMDQSGVYLIDTSGLRLTPQNFEDISTWNDQFFGAKFFGEPFWVLMNYDGQTVLNDSFYGVWPSDNETVCVNRLGGYRFVDHKGNLLFGKAFIEARPFSQGWASIRMENDWFLMDERGKIKKDVRMKTGIRLNGAMTSALNYNGKVGFLNRQANWIYTTP